MRILLIMPRYNSTVNVEAAAAFFQPQRPDSRLKVKGGSPGSSLLCSTFNAGWASARNYFEAGDVDGFAMIHADMGAEAGWIDILHDEMKKARADIISAVIPIKDDRGLTSTAVDDTEDQWTPRRLTTKEIEALPTTFTDEDVGGPLLVNTGCWICRLGPWCMEVFFRTHDCIRKEETGWRARVQPEDWDFSRQCRAHGLKIAATKAVRIKHHGEWFWPNYGKPYGWETDKANGRKELVEIKGD